MMPLYFAPRRIVRTPMTVIKGQGKGCSSCGR